MAPLCKWSRRSCSFCCVVLFPVNVLATAFYWRDCFGIALGSLWDCCRRGINWDCCYEVNSPIAIALPSPGTALGLLGIIANNPILRLFGIAEQFQSNPLFFIEGTEMGLLHQLTKKVCQRWAAAGRGSIHVPHARESAFLPIVLRDCYLTDMGQSDNINCCKTLQLTKRQPTLAAVGRGSIHVPRAREAAFLPVVLRDCY